jgi:hypothetical protein
MPRGGDRGGRRPKTLHTQVTKAYSLNITHAAKIKAWAQAWECSESEALRRILDKATFATLKDTLDV